MAYLAIDFGGTRTRAAWFAEDLTLLDRAETATQATDPVETVIERIIATAKQVLPGGAQPDAVGIAGPGPLDPERGVILHAETLPGWHQVPLVQRVQDAFGGVPVVLQNDANLAALAEAVMGSATGESPVIYLTISTGIGGGAVINGNLFTGGYGLAIEPGHQVFRLSDGSVKKLEELASGTALGKAATDHLRADPDTSSRLRDANPLDGAAVGRAALAGDDLAREIVTTAAGWLGLGVVNLAHLFNPAAIVLGGSVTDLGDLLLGPVREAIQTHALAPGFAPSGLIRRAALGDDVCLYGAAQHALQAHQYSKNNT